MRLHLGCGDLFLPDALNIDKYDLRVADVQADAIRLPVRSETCDEVIAYHVFEHLGYIGSVYALAESFRVLKSGGILEVETPDPERSFKAFLERTDPFRRAALLTWVFGTECPGMGHRGLFPKELLEKLVRESGFCDLKITEPNTHRHRWGFRLLARKGPNPSVRLISRLRPLLVSDILHEATPQEALEIELRLWEPLYRLGQGALSPEEAEDRLLEWTAIVPLIMIFWSDLSQKDSHLPKPPCKFNLIDLGKVARLLIDLQFCAILRDAFSILCATVNQVTDGYHHLLAAAKGMVKKWLAWPPSEPEQDVFRDLETFGIMFHPDPNRSFPGDLELSSGQMTIEGRKASWPRHALFTRQHLIDRAQWFRDLGIRCFSSGDLEDARRLFRLAINSKMEGLYTVWNMARLQTALGQKNNAEIFYQAALGFPMSEKIKDQILSELQNYTLKMPGSIGPVSVGEGEDRILGFLEKAVHNRETFTKSSPLKEFVHYPPPQTLLWELTLKCQCRCTHCAAAGGKPRPDELTTKEALDVCEQIAKLAVPSVCLMGGEPLLHPDWERIAFRLRELGLDLGLATNGIALDSQTWRKLEHLKFSQVVISLDGSSPEVHDKRRRWKGALNAAQKAIRKMISLPIRERTIVTSIDKTNLGELEALRDWLLENAPGVTWMINVASPSTGSRMKKSHAIEKEEFLSLVRFIAENRVGYKDQLNITATHCIGYFSQKYTDLYNYTWSGCQAGITTLGLRSDGTVTGCLIMSDHFIEGNVRQQGLCEIWSNPKSFSYNRNFSTDMLKGKCHSCRWGEICRGGCRETAYSFTGEAFEPPFCLYDLESMDVI